MKEQVEKALESIRPSLQADGGDVELVNVDDKSGAVSVRLTGACRGCPMARITLTQGVEAVLKRMVPEVKEVTAVP